MNNIWWVSLKNNKALKLFKKYLLQIINDLNEREIKIHMYRQNLNIDEVLIEESSKEIDNYLKIKTKKKEEKPENIRNENKRNISLLYMCLLKFNGLLRYIYFQGLNHQDINKMAHFIKHTFKKKGSYVFRQYDKSDALYGVIKGKAVIRLIENIDYTKKFANEATQGEINLEPPENINVQYFMSDCEEESEEEEEKEENENDNKTNNDNLDNNVKNKNEKENGSNILFKKIKIKSKNQEENNPLKKELNNIFKKKSSKKLILKNDDISDLIILKKIREKFKKRIKKNNKEEENIKEKKIIKAITEHQTPNEELKGKILENFIKEFEKENFALTNGMCFGEWGLLYSIPRTTSIYLSEDTHLFYLEKEYFNKTLLAKFLRNDSEKIKFLLHKFPIFKKNFKIRHIFTKIIPLFLNKDNIIYTPFDNAEDIYLLYQGEGILVNLPYAKDREDYFLKKSNWQIISRLQAGAIAGIESCLETKNKYENAFIITREFTTLLKINVQYFTQLYKDFNKSLIPLYQAQQILYKHIKNSAQKVYQNNNSKRKFSLSKVVKEVLSENKKKKFNNDFQIHKIKFNLDKTEKIPKKTLNHIRLKLNFENKDQINLISKFDTSSTNRKTTLSPFSTERERITFNNNELLLNSTSRNIHSNYSKTDNNSYYNRTNIKESFMSNSHKRSQSSFSKKINQGIINKVNIEKVCRDLKKKILSFQTIDTGMFHLPLLTLANEKYN